MTQQPAAVRQLQSLAHSLREDGRVDEAFEVLLDALSTVVVRNAELELVLKKLKDARRGATSERVSAEQMSLLTTLLAAATDEGAEPDIEAEAEADAALEEEIEEAQAGNGEGEAKPKRRRNAGIHMDDLPVEVTEVPVPDDKADWEVIGYDTTVRLRYKRAHFYREEIRTPVLRAPELDDGGEIEIVKLRDQVPPTLVTGSLAGTDVIAGLLVSKYERHMPLHRFHRAVLSEQGLNLPVSTLCDWAAHGGDACRRLASALRERVLDSFLVRTDATGIRVLSKEGPDGIHRGTIWCYVGQSAEPEKPPDVYFHYTTTGEGETGPWSVLAGRQGYVQADALNVYDRVFNGLAANATEVGCNAHARRKFKTLLPDEARAAYVVQLIRRAYRVEKLASKKWLSPEERTALRQKKTRPIFDDKLRPYLERLIAADHPSSPLRDAAQYYINHWDALTRFIDDGRLPLDNNDVERQLRAVRLGENNYLFAGSDAAAERLAAILSVLATCRAHDINTLDYLTDAFNRLAQGASASQIRDMLPDRWTPEA